MLVVTGVKLRTDQLPYHSNVWGIDWLYYYEAQARHLRFANLFAWLGSWQGLHPPLSGTAHRAQPALSMPMTGHWGLTLAAGLGAAVLMGLEGWRRTTLVAPVLVVGWLALSPMQANYGLNTSPYPWSLLLAAVSTVALLRALDSDSDRAWWGAAIASALAAQVHLLVTAAVMGQALLLALHGPAWWKERGRGLKRWALLVGGSMAWVCAMSALKTRDPWTFHVEAQVPWPETMLHMLGSRFLSFDDQRIVALCVAVGVVAGLAVGPRRAIALMGLQVLGFVAALGLFCELGVADPRLTHYWIVPQMLVLSAGAWGLASVGSRWPRATWPTLALAIAASVPWGLSAGEWYERKADEADALIAGSAADELRPLWAEAGRGDVVVYLWDYAFLNDEPEQMDPIAARWPTWRTGRPCFDEVAPRMHCNRHGGARFYFHPSGLTHDPLESVEEMLRITLNQAEPPGRAVLVAVPNPGESAPRPWPWEAWLREHGARSLEVSSGDVVVYELPPGTRIPEPPPEG